MYQAAFFIGDRRYVISYERIEREAELLIYWGTIYLSKAIEFGCMKIDEQPIFITHPVTLPTSVESAILNVLAQEEKNNKQAAEANWLNAAC